MWGTFLFCAVMNFSLSHLARTIALLLLTASPAFAESADELFNRGFALHMQGKLQEAVSCYSDAIDEVPTFAMAFQMRALAYQQLKKFPKAVNDYSSAIEQGDASFKVVGYYNRGVVKNIMGDFVGAVDDFSQAIVLNKKMATAFFHRGIARHQLGDNDGRFEDFRQAALLGDRTAEQWLNTYHPNWKPVPPSPPSIPPSIPSSLPATAPPIQPSSPPTAPTDAPKPASVQPAPSEPNDSTRTSATTPA
uniref:TPR repeat n=1 Tax=Chlorobium chlorochromatii (strain CaD3) TaxID=340177 RepID=Q3AP30_CHLCH